MGYCAAVGKILELGKVPHEYFLLFQVFCGQASGCAGCLPAASLRCVCVIYSIPPLLRAADRIQHKHNMTPLDNVCVGASRSWLNQEVCVCSWCVNCCYWFTIPRGIEKWEVLSARSNNHEHICLGWANTERLSEPRRRPCRRFIGAPLHRDTRSRRLRLGRLAGLFFSPVWGVLVRGTATEGWNNTKPVCGDRIIRCVRSNSCNARGYPVRRFYLKLPTRISEYSPGLVDI